MPKLDITSQERSALRAAAHPLHPVVLIGDKGLTQAVLKEIDQNLNAHELIKVRVSGQERADRESTLETICETLSCAPVHHLGKTLILYRPDAEKALAEEQARNATRALRKPSEAYISKKQAASGTTAARKTKSTKGAGKPVREAAPAKRPARSAQSQAPAHGIPRRSGSALTLRAGARRNAGGTGSRKR
ncbi:MAG TPA: YhbY family RNA-binding protein [Pusillimonas sp.]|uniref:YhbY family RNA-binding protein n=1 Tax=Pusillimonas sp. TaxID=3040095 RepID=UPI002CA08CA8|nr:YhbY family RNA-binding protein [Pusillimonas sp.]HUH88066.1 YhbY family RNA-binding protein [Pusillimonas sp.]